MSQLIDNRIPLIAQYQKPCMFVLKILPYFLLFINIPTDKIQKTSKMSDAAQQHYWCPGPPLGEGED